MRAAIACVMITAGAARADVPVVQADDVIATVEAALAKPDPKAAAGTAHEIAWVEKVTDVRATVKQWREQLAKTKLTILFEDVDDGSATFVVEAPTKARATLGASLWNGGIFVTPKPVLGTKLPGACVAVPAVTHEVWIHSRGVDQQGEHHVDQRERRMVTSRSLDVDGDGLPDAFVPVPPTKHACPEEVPLRVYVMRGACGHEVGIVGPGWFSADATVTPLDASGLRPLTIAAESTRFGKRVQPGGPIPEHVTTTRTFAVTKGRYAKTSESTRVGLCHHCSTWSCRSK